MTQSVLPKLQYRVRQSVSGGVILQIFVNSHFVDELELPRLSTLALTPQTLALWQSYASAISDDDLQELSE